MVAGVFVHVPFRRQSGGKQAGKPARGLGSTSNVGVAISATLLASASLTAAGVDVGSLEFAAAAAVAEEFADAMNI